jgi:hypothetical protein
MPESDGIWKVLKKFEKGLRRENGVFFTVAESISQHDAEISSEEQPVQGLVLASPASKVYKLAWEVKGTTGYDLGGAGG